MNKEMVKSFTSRQKHNMIQDLNERLAIVMKEYDREIVAIKQDISLLQGVDKDGKVF